MRRRFAYDAASMREPQVHEQGQQWAQQDPSWQTQRPRCPRAAPHATESQLAPAPSESEREPCPDERGGHQLRQQTTLHASGAAQHRQFVFGSDTPEVRPLLDLSAALRSFLPDMERPTTQDFPAAVDTHEGQVGRSAVGSGLSTSREGCIASERQTRDSSSTHLTNAMPHQLLCHFCLRFCMERPGAHLAANSPATDPPNESPTLPRVECATCRDVVCVECIRQLFAPMTSAAHLSSLVDTLRDTHASRADENVRIDEAQARAGESSLQTQLRQLTVFLGHASGRWVCPKCDAKCACQSNRARRDVLEAVHQRHQRKRWPCPPPSHLCWRGYGQSVYGTLDSEAAGSTFPWHRPADRQTTLNFAPSRNEARQRHVRSRGGVRHGGERSLRDVAERMRQNMPATSARMERWLRISSERARQSREKEWQLQREVHQQPPQQQEHSVDLDKPHGLSSVGAKRSTIHAPTSASTGPEAGGVKRRKGQPMRDAATLRTLDQIPPPMPPPPLSSGWRLASLAPPWHATAGAAASTSGDATVMADRYTDAIRKELASALRMFLLCTTTPALDPDQPPSLRTTETLNEGGSISKEDASGRVHSTAGGNSTSPPAVPGEESYRGIDGQSRGTETSSAPEAQSAEAAAAAADFLEAKAAAACESAWVCYMGSLQRVQSLAEAAVRHLPAEAMDAIMAAIVESIRAFPSMLKGMLVSSSVSSGSDGEPAAGHMHLQLHWLVLEWFNVASGHMQESTQRRLWIYAGGVIDDLLPLFVLLPHACSLPCACTGSQPAGTPPPLYIETVNRPVLALWLYVQQSIDKHCDGMPSSGPHPSTPFWALLTERLLAQGARLRVVARSASRHELQPDSEDVTTAQAREMWTFVHLTELQQLRWRRLCLASLLPIYSLDAQGMPMHDGVKHSGKCNWALVHSMLLGSCLNPKQQHKLGYGASDDSTAAATELLRLCCDLSTEWEPNFNLAFDVWKWSPPPTAKCSSARADHRFPPFTEWKEEVPYGDPARPTRRLAAAAWAAGDDCRMLALRFVTAEMFSLTSTKGALSKLMSWADRGPMEVCCPRTHHGLQADSMRRRGCVDELWSTSTSFLLAAEMQRDSPASLTKLAKKIMHMLPLDNSSLCACYIVIEALLQLFRRVQESGTDVTPIAGSVNSILEKLALAVGVPAASPLAAGGATGSNGTISARPQIDGAGELLVYLLENMVSLIERVADMPPTPGPDASGEALLLGEPLAMLALCSEPHFCSPALRVVEVAIDTALLNPLVEEHDADVDIMEDDDIFGGIDLDDAKLRAAQKMDKFRRECTEVLTSVWRGGEVLHERFTSRWRSRPDDESGRRRLIRDVVRTWARMQAFLLKGMPQEARLRALDRHKEGLLKEEALIRFTDVKTLATHRELRELRMVPMQFFCCLLEIDPDLSSTVLRHFSAAIERLWLAAMVEPACLESRYGQRQFTRVLLSAVTKHAEPTAPILMALRAVPNELLAGRESFQRIDVLTTVLGDVASQLGPHPAKEVLARMERLLRFVCAQLYRCNMEFPRARSANSSTGLTGRQRAIDESDSECKQYAYFACWFACTLLEKIPQVVLASDGYTYEWLVGKFIQSALDGTEVHPALHKQAVSRLRELLILLANLGGRDEPRTTKTLDVIFRAGLSLDPQKQNTAVSRDELLRALQEPLLAGLASRQLQYVMLPRLFLPRRDLQPSAYASRVAIARDTLSQVLHGYLAIPPNTAAPHLLPSKTHERTLHELVIPSLLSSLIASQATDQAAAIYLSLRFFQQLISGLLLRSVFAEPCEPADPAASHSSVLQRMNDKDAALATEILMSVYVRMAVGAAACSISSRCSTSSRWLNYWAGQKRSIDENLGRLQLDLQTRYPQVPRGPPASLPSVPTCNLPAEPRQQYVKCVECLESLIRLLQQARHCRGMACLSKLGARLQPILDASERMEQAPHGAMHPDVYLVIRGVLCANSQALGLRQSHIQPLAAPIAAPPRQTSDPSKPHAFPAGEARHSMSAPQRPGAMLNSAGLGHAVVRYADQRVKLGAMGFTNDNRNLSVLQMTGGDIGRAIDKLTNSA